MTDYDLDDYDQLRAEMADPEQAQAALCPRCGFHFTFRCWPGGDQHGDRQDVLASFLDGLAELARFDDPHPVYGMWVLDPDHADSCPLGDETIELWNPRTRSLITTGSAADIGEAMRTHICAP